MTPTREEQRERTRARILAAARTAVAEHGGQGVSMRALAREAGVVSSAVYRYFESREALLTAMIVESYGHLADALTGDDDPGPDTPAGHDPDDHDTPGETWDRLAHRLRAWARAHPHEFQLVYGTPIPGYTAPPETVPAAAAVAEPFLAAGARAPVPSFDSPLLRDQLAPLAGPDRDPAGAAAVLAELTALVGFCSLELAGHLVGTADPADELYRALVRRQRVTLGL